MPALELPPLWEGSGRTSRGQNRTREIRPSGIVGGLTETWGMVSAKRARTAERPKQPSPHLNRRAPCFYPDRQHYAITAGLKASKGEYVVLMDSDLQDNPKYIHDLIKKSKEGFDIVLTLKIDRNHGRVENFFCGAFS